MPETSDRNRMAGQHDPAEPAPLKMTMKRGMIGRMDALSLDMDTFAPWAETVARAGPVTVNDLLALPDHGGWRYEVVEGVLVRVAGSRPRAVRVTMRLLRALDSYVEEHELGQVTPPDAVYDFEHTGQPNTGLLPDIGFYVTAREALVEDDKPYPFAPDLAVEVVSPLQSTSDMAVKARRYLRGGTRLVWVIYPHLQRIEVWHPGDGPSPSTLGMADALDGEEVVPGFQYPVAPLLRDR